MNKVELRNFLESKFEIVLDSSPNAGVIEANKSILGIMPGSIDDKAYAWVSEYIAMNRKGQIFYVLYYGKKNTKLVWDNKSKSINTILKNGVVQRYTYDRLLKQVKKYLPKSKAHIVFFCSTDVEFEPETNNKIYLLNELNVDRFLEDFYDFK